MLPSSRFAELRARVARRLASERGTAALEFVTAGLILLLPTVYLIVALAGIQGAQLAAAGAARQAARVYVQAESDADASAEASAAVAFTLADFGLPPEGATVHVDCSPRPDACLTRLGTVAVTVQVRAPLPLVPDVLDLRRNASVVVQAQSTNRVSRLWGAG
jgi:Flp pilus assembly protein TadG